MSKEIADGDAQTNGKAQVEETELEVAASFAKQFSPVMRYAVAQKSWVVWDGKIWRKENDNAALGKIIEFVGTTRKSAKDFHLRGLLIEAEAADKLVRKISNYRFLSNALRLAAAMPGMPIEEKEFDSNPLVLNCQNGILDLKTKELLPHDPKYFCTKLANVSFDEKATAPLWENFIERIFRHDKSLPEYIHTVLGYCLTGLNTEQSWYFLYGAGSNGKSTLLGTMQNLLGDYCTNASMNTFIIQSSDSPRSDLAALRGARLVIVPETNNSSKFDSALLKQITGGDPITCRHLYGSFFSYTPPFKLFMHGNDKPAIRDSSEGAWRRPKPIPCTQQIPTSEQIKNLPDLLRNQLPGILNLLLTGLDSFLSNGLNHPPIVLQALAEYRSDFDSIPDWLSFATISEPGAKTLQKDLLQSFLAFLDSNGSSTDIRPERFSRMLDQKGVPKGPKIHGCSTRSGIRLKTPLELSVEEKDSPSAENTATPIL